MRPSRAPLALLASLALLPAASAGDMIGVTWGGTVVDVDSTTGAGTVVGAAGVGSLNAMAVTSAGVIYASTGNFSWSLVTIDGTSGLAQPTGITAPGDVRGMAFDVSDALYVVVDASPSDVLHRIDVPTGISTPVGKTGVTGVHSLAFAGGVLYAWDGGSPSFPGKGLVRLDTSSGAHTDVGPAGGSLLDMQFLTADGAGTLYGGRHDLHTIDVGTGLATPIGPIGVPDLRGCDFRTPSACPGGWSHYGSGVAGETGLPELRLVGPPIAGTAPALDVDSSSSAPQTAILFVGAAPAQIPGFWGGDLLVQPLASPTLPLSSAGFLLPLPIPNDANLCQLKVVLQLLQSDPIAPLGVASSRGLEIVIGL